MRASDLCEGSSAVEEQCVSVVKDFVFRTSSYHMRAPFVRRLGVPRFNSSEAHGLGTSDIQHLTWRVGSVTGDQISHWYRYPVSPRIRSGMEISREGHGYTFCIWCVPWAAAPTFCCLCFRVERFPPRRTPARSHIQAAGEPFHRGAQPTLA